MKINPFKTFKWINAILYQKLAIEETINCITIDK